MIDHIPDVRLLSRRHSPNIQLVHARRPKASQPRGRALSTDFALWPRQRVTGHKPIASLVTRVRVEHPSSDLAWTFSRAETQYNWNYDQRRRGSSSLERQPSPAVNRARSCNSQASGGKGEWIASAPSDTAVSTAH
eukprot:3359727-Pleurochrysis_carterae.AAC.7